MTGPGVDRESRDETTAALFALTRELAAAEVAPLCVGAGQPQRLAVADRRLLRPSQAAVQVGF